MKKRKFLLPFAMTLAAFSQDKLESKEHLKALDEKPKQSQESIEDFTLFKGDSVKFGYHRSHMSHQSHRSHMSHQSHYSSSW
mgnify:CR=1 FL=1